MMRMHGPVTGPWWVMLPVTILLAGCATLGGQPEPVQPDAAALIERGYYEEGLARLAEEERRKPGDADARIALALQRDQVIARLLAEAETARSVGRHEEAAAIHARLLRIDPDNVRAAEGLRRFDQHRHLSEMQRQGEMALRRGDLEGASRHAAAMVFLDPHHATGLELRRTVEDARARQEVPYPQLRSRLSRPVSLEFRDANLKVIFEVLAEAAGLNFILDREIRPDATATIFVRQVPVEDAVDLLLVQNQLLRKTINDNTIVIYPNLPQKVREYQELHLRTFFLTNINAEVASDLIKTMLKTRDVFIDARLNTLTMRDTRDSIRLAEKLLLAQDQPDPEVVFEIEVMEVSRQRLLDLGIQWPNTFTALSPEQGAIATLDQLRGLDSSRIGLSGSAGGSGSPSARAQARDSDVNTLATPVIRVRNKEKANIHIGNRIPIVSATTTPSTQGPVFTESITFLDVGLKIDLEPTVYADDEVGVRITLEVSNSIDRGRTQAGSTLVEVSTRNAGTTLRLKDGETQILAGLLRNDVSRSADKIPGIGDIPGLGRLFGQRQDSETKTELVLSITPRIVRNLPYMAPNQMEFPSGTEALLRTATMSLRGADAREAVDLAALARGPAPAPAPGLPAASPVAAPAVPLALSWAGPPELVVGDEATLSLQASGVRAMQSGMVQLAYDPTALELIELSPGDLLRGSGPASFNPRIDQRSGQIFIALGRAATEATTGDGELLQLRVRAVAPSDDVTTVRLLSFSARGPNNRLLESRMPEALDMTVRE